MTRAVIFFATQWRGPLAVIARAAWLALPLIVACLPDVAAAQGVESPQRIEDAFPFLEGVVKNNGVDLAAVGTKLLVTLFLIAFTWQMGTFVLEGAQWADHLGGVLRTVFLGSMAFLFLTPLQGGSILPSQTGQLPLVGFLDSMTSSITGVILGNGDGSMGEILKSAMTSFFDAAAKIALLLGSPFKGATSLSGAISEFTVFFSNLPSLIYLCVALLVMLLAGIVLFVMASAGLLMFTIGAMLAPVFIPWMVFPAASWLFDGWLRFMITSSLYKIAGAAIVTLGGTVLTKAVAGLPMLDDAANFNASELSTTTVTAMLVAGVAAALAYIALQIPSIANGLTSGNSSIGMARLMSNLGRGGQQAAGLALSTGGGTLSGIGNSGRGFTATVNAGRQTLSAASQAASNLRTSARNAVAGATLLGATGGAGAVARAAGGAALRSVARGTMSVGRGAGAGLRSTGDALTRVGNGMISGRRR